MSLSTPNRSRTFTILSGEAISVSARLSGFTFEMSVMGWPYGKGARASTRDDFGRQREELHETLRQRHVSLDLDRVRRCAAVDHAGHCVGGTAKGHVAILDLAPFDIEAAVAEGEDV